jgi:ankyrin repeat protein
MSLRNLNKGPFRILFITILSFGISSCSISLKKKSSRKFAQILKKPKINKATYWGKRLVALTYAQGNSLDDSFLGKKCGVEIGIKGIKECLKMGANINFKTEEGMTALLGAVEKGNDVLVRELIKAGADLSLGDNQGFTPIMKASLLGDFDVVKVLVEGGANLGPIKEGNWRGMRPLDIADFYLHKKVGHYLRIKMGWPIL